MSTVNTHNAAATTDRTVEAFTARYVRVMITKAVADAVPDKTARLPRRG